MVKAWRICNAAIYLAWTLTGLTTLATYNLPAYGGVKSAIPITGLFYGTKQHSVIRSWSWFTDLEPPVMTGKRNYVLWLASRCMLLAAVLSCSNMLVSRGLLRGDLMQVRVVSKDKLPTVDINEAWMSRTSCHSGL